MTYPYLSDSDIAAEFLRGNLIGQNERAETLVGRVRDWLARVDLAHRDPHDVAIEAVRIAAARPAPTPSIVDPAEAARLDDLRQGIGDPQTLSPDQVRDMSLQEFAALRAQIGLGQSKGIGVLGRLT